MFETYFSKEGNISEMYDILDSFLPGFGKRDKKDINNAVFIVNELFNLGLSLKWRGAGCQGIQSLKLYGMLALKGWPFESFIYCWTKEVNV